MSCRLNPNSKQLLSWNIRSQKVDYKFEEKKKAYSEFSAFIEHEAKLGQWFWVYAKANKRSCKQEF